MPGLGEALVGGSEYAIRKLQNDDPEVISAALTALATYWWRRSTTSTPDTSPCGGSRRTNRSTGIPEIQDFNVLPKFRRRGIGTGLMDAAEALVAERSDVVAIGVGLYADYGTAQRMYVRRGYIPDGRGLYNLAQVPPGEMVRNDDDAILMFSKPLRRSTA